jgi:hypothetical protein
MTLSQIEKNIESLLVNFNQQEFIYNFLLAYNSPKSVIQRLKKGSLNLSKNADEIILKKKVFYKVVTTLELETIISLLVENKTIAKNQIRFVIVTDYQTLIAIDTKTKEQIEIPITDLNKHVTFFLPLAGMEKYQAEEEKDADVKAATYMAKLFDEIKKTNSTQTTEEVHYLNVFLSRLLFCFFAEDTDIFSKGLFTSSINNYTQEDGSDLGDFLTQLFNVLNIEHRTNDTPSYLKVFPYVNGGLFRDQIPLPIFTFKSRDAILKSGGENWAAINPDIFGSMIQAVVTPDKRGNLGMHYTSVPNIMKVIRPLFLDELEEEFEAAKFNATALNKLLGRIANIRIFDPACGSGNFLIIAYKQLRYLEIKILLQLKSLQSNSLTGFEEKQSALFAKPQLTLADNTNQAVQLEMFSRIELNHFYGIELDDFAHEIAKLSLWLAQHQMNVEFKKIFGATSATLPLRDAGVIVQGNATRLNWETVCPKPKVGEVFILGNPPYIGFNERKNSHKLDMDYVFKDNGNIKRLDYIGCWFKIATDYISKTQHTYAFVTTNSICQGEQVSLIWPYIYSKRQEIKFAYKSFKWGNNAKAKAAVICNIIGVVNLNNANKKLYSNDLYQSVKNISPYLVEGNNTVMYQRVKPLSNLPEMELGSSGIDGGNLILSKEEKDNFILDDSKSKKFIKEFIGGADFINGNNRYCLWINDNEIEEAKSINQINTRIQKCREFRLTAGRDALKGAAVPHRFFYRKHKEKDAIILAMTGSVRREYLPIGFTHNNPIISNGVFIIYEFEVYLFSLLCSKMHNLWISITSGRLKMDYRYSVNLTYNTFPFPTMSQSQKEELEQHTHNILEQRAKYSEKTLSELYDPDKMPKNLKEAHHQLDLAVERCYRSKPFENDEERLAHLFSLYENMIEEEKTKGTIFQKEQKPKKNKK